jgi:hypothetical protein
MADNQLVYTHFETGVDVYAIFTAPDGQVWATDSSAMETYATADIADYDVAAVEEGTASRRYKLTIPALPADMYRADFFKRAGASPAEGDLFLGSIGDIVWNGTAIVHVVAAAITNLNTVFNTDFANAYNTTADCFRAQLDNNVEHGGSTATVVLKSMNVTNSTGNAVQFTSSGSNGSGLELSGNGSGHGLFFTGGMSGAAAYFAGIGQPALILESTSGDVIQIISDAGNGDGIQITANGTGKDINLAGSGTIAGTVTGLDAKLDAIDNFIDTEIADIISALATAQADLDTITGAAGALIDAGTGAGQLSISSGLLAWNAAWDAEVQSEVTDALNAYDPPTNTEMTSAFTEIKGATWASTDSLENIRNELVVVDGIVDDILVDTSTTLDGKLDAIDNFVDTEVAAIISTIGVAGAGLTAIPQLSSALTEAYRAHGATGTIAQLLYELIGHHGAKEVSGTTMTVKKLDGSTSAKTYLLNDADAPTSIVHAS